MVSLHELLEDLQEEGFVLRGAAQLGSTGQVGRVGSFALQVALGSEDVQSIVHFVEFQELPNQFTTEHA